MLGKPRILSLFRNKSNQFNNTEARILDSKINQKSHIWRENVMILSSFTQRYNGRHYVTLLNL